LTPSYSLNNLDNQRLQQQQHSQATVLNREPVSLANQINATKNNTQEQQNLISNELEELNTREMASMSVSSTSSATNSSPALENYLLDLKKVIEWLANSDNVLNNQPSIGDDVNSVKQQFQTHEVRITIAEIYKI
jgi:hypothetical protein